MRANIFKKQKIVLCINHHIKKTLLNYYGRL